MNHTPVSPASVTGSPTRFVKRETSLDPDTLFSPRDSRAAKKAARKWIFGARRGKKDGGETEKQEKKGPSYQSMKFTPVSPILLGAKAKASLPNSPFSKQRQQRSPEGRRSPERRSVARAVSDEIHRRSPRRTGENTLMRTPIVEETGDNNSTDASEVAAAAAAVAATSPLPPKPSRTGNTRRGGRRPGVARGHSESSACPTTTVVIPASIDLAADHKSPRKSFAILADAVAGFDAAMMDSLDSSMMDSMDSFEAYINPASAQQQQSATPTC